MIVYDKTMILEQLSIHILYEYNDFLENMIYQWKEQRDVALRQSFIQLYVKQINRKYKNYTIVFMPSSENKTKMRGFHSLEQLYLDVSLPKVHLFEKIGDHKQSIQGFDKRKEINKYIKLKEGVMIPQTPLLLVDDVCTSGSTLLHAYFLLQGHKYKIKALVLCANHRLIHRRISKIDKLLGR